MTYRRQKRWWNAYILFYERVDEEEIISKSIQDLSISKYSIVDILYKKSNICTHVLSHK